jgi:polysaccharide export outer membrane protein
MKRLLAGLAGLLVLGGCASTPGLDPNGAVLTSLAELPPPTLMDRYAHSPVYTVGPFDELTVTIDELPDYKADVTADAQARLSVPMAGTIEAAGLSPIEVAERITQSLRRKIRDPHVAVNIKDVKSRTITVDGQVKDPGVYDARSNLSLMRAIATAKGTSEDANEKDVVIFRTVEGKKMAALYNLAAIRRGTYADPVIYPDDIIVVGDSPTSRLIRQLGPVISTPLVLLIQTL